MSVDQAAYDKFVAERVSRILGADLAERLQITDLRGPCGPKLDLLHGVIGVVTEAVELLDAMKKHLFYGKPLDVVNVEEELGDCEFYLSQIRQALGLTREGTVEKNVAKLTHRYPKGFDAQRAVERDLEGERQILEGKGAA